MTLADTLRAAAATARQEGDDWLYRDDSARGSSMQAWCYERAAALKAQADALDAQAALVSA